MTSPNFLIADGPDGKALFAAIVPNVQFCQSEVADIRLMARLRPFPSEDAARAAMVEAGGANIRPEAGRAKR